ncbi:MAG: M42 family peptidase [Bacillota bacterium]
MKELLAQLTAVWGPPGREQAVAAAIADLVRPHVDEVRTDALGNLLAVRRPRGTAATAAPKLLLVAHMDAPGGIVTGYTDRGQLRFAPVGGLSLVAARGQRVRFADGRLGVLAGEPVDDPKEVKLQNAWVDIGARSREEAEAWVRAGEFFVLHGELTDLGSRWAGPALDNRAGCAAVVAALRRLGDSPWEIHLAFTVQGQVAPRGARTATYQVRPDLAVVVDATPAEGKEGAAARLGAGPALRLKDGGWVLRPAARVAMERAAAAAGVQWQPEVVPSGSTEAAGVQSVEEGVPTAVLGIPIRYRGTPVEVVDPGDLDGAVAWLHALMSQHPAPEPGTEAAGGA